MLSEFALLILILFVAVILFWMGAFRVADLLRGKRKRKNDTVTLGELLASDVFEESEEKAKNGLPPIEPGYMSSWR